MSARRIRPDEIGPGAEIERWRRHQLLAAGFAPDLAAELAGSAAVDLHGLLHLVDRGCPPVLAARILAPLDGLSIDERSA